ncbi:hypothetical protein PHYPSEUDO_009366 [Phytophthora pseudosyringae]|uniref:GAF domain-containing protein n=1 Tax=Phytophthora pseudosyringae TaxID=221518 RepID=A0A8T1WCS6_9STRA|nr:hypothetical protein PHYPSEUDO_009366 [Phytophthora pseudosyringae]
MNAKEAAGGSIGEGGQEEDAAVKTVTTEASTKSNNESDARKLSGTTPVLKRRSSSTLSLDLAELSLLDVLTHAATDILGSIPAQRCIVYVYDMAANLLRPQVVVDCNDKDAGEAQTESSSEPQAPVTEEAGEVSNSSNAVDVAIEDVTTSPLVSFPPVVGMVSSCFLQRSCLRMQEPNPHRTFHREYDVPKDMQVGSILCAPVILYHRAIAVIQLLNRMDTTGDRIPFEDVEHDASPQDVKNEASSEVTLRRLKTVKSIVLIGFSIKDEQKLLHFTTHIAHTIDIKAKKLANVRNHAKIREDKAQQALDLLNALNGDIVALVNSSEMLRPTNVAERAIYVRHATITRLPSQREVLTDRLGALVVIMRLQAMFRGRRQRRAERFTEELEKFRRQRERMKTVIVMQRVAHAPEEPKPRVHEKPKTSRPKEGSSRSKVRVEEPKKPPQSPLRPSVNTPASPRPRPPQQQAAPPPRPPSQPTRIHSRRTSAVKIQKVFRRHQQRRHALRPATPAKPVDCEVSKEVPSAVKMQSFIRGNLVRKRLRQALLSPLIVCLRVASSSDEVAANQIGSDSPRSAKLRSQTCVYAMPERPTIAPPIHRRTSASSHNQEELLDEYQPQSKTQGVAVQSRQLVAIHRGDATPRLQKLPTRRPRPRWDRLVSSVVWETAQHAGHELAPPAVEFVNRSRPNAKRPEAQSDKVNSPRAASPASAAESSRNQSGATKPSVRLPALAPQPQPRDAGQGSLLCCLLPAQSKRSAGGIAPIAQASRRAVKAKQTPSTAAAVQPTGDAPARD